MSDYISDHDLSGDGRVRMGRDDDAYWHTKTLKDDLKEFLGLQDEKYEMNCRRPFYDVNLDGYIDESDINSYMRRLYELNANEKGVWGPDEFRSVIKKSGTAPNPDDF